MNRRSLLMLTTLLGGVICPRLQGQVLRRRGSSGSRVARGSGFVPAGRASDRDFLGEPDDVGAAGEPSPEAPPAGFFNEPGHRLQTFDIARYTRVAQGQQNPQKAIIDWIFRRTGTADWHGERVAVLAANKAKLTVYNSPEILEQVSEIVERFTHAEEDFLSIHVRFFATADTRWRYSVFSQLTPVGNGPQGQQIWTMRMADAALVISQMQVQQGFRKLADERVEMVNGQTLTIRTSEPRSYSGGLQRESGFGLGFAPRTDKLEESIVLKLSPLLTFDGDTLDASIDLTVNTVRTFHRTKVIAPREAGPPEMSIDVPEVTQTRLDQTIKNWPLGQSLLITGGIHPGILDKKGGWLGTPIGAPSSTEVLVFLDAETVSRGRSRRPVVEDREPSAKVPEAEDSAARPSRGSRRATRGPDLETEFDD